MKRYRTITAIALGVLIPATSATAWWQWFHQETPYGPAPGMWFYQNVPQANASGQTGPAFWHYQSPRAGLPTMWSSMTPMSSLAVEQSASPLGYNIRVHTAHPDTTDIEIGVEGYTLVIKQRPMQRVGWSSQWVSLPADANIRSMRMSRGNGLVEIFVPRAR